MRSLSGFRQVLGDALRALGAKGVRQHPLGGVEAAVASATRNGLAEFFQDTDSVWSAVTLSSRTIALLTALTSSSFNCLSSSLPSFSPRATMRMAAFCGPVNFAALVSVTVTRCCPLQRASRAGCRPRASGLFLPFSCSWVRSTSVREGIRAGMEPAADWNAAAAAAALGRDAGTADGATGCGRAAGASARLRRFIMRTTPNTIKSNSSAAPPTEPHRTAGFFFSVSSENELSEALGAAGAGAGEARRSCWCRTAALRQ